MLKVRWPLALTGAGRGVHDEFDVGAISRRSRAIGRGWTTVRRARLGARARAATSARCQRRDPLRLAITASGLFKGELTADQILEIDDRCIVLEADAGASHRLKPSCMWRSCGRGTRARSCTRTRSGARCCPTALETIGGLTVDGYEMLKGLEGVTTHEHREWIPVLDNDQDMTRLWRSRAGHRCRPIPPVMHSCCVVTGCTRGARPWRTRFVTSRFLSSCWKRSGAAGATVAAMRRRAPLPDPTEIR